MKRLLNLAIVGILCAVAVINRQPLAADAFENTHGTSVLTMESALQRVEYHSDYQSWLESLDDTDDTVRNILNSQAVQLSVDGSLLSYTYNLETEDGTARGISPSLSLSRSTLGGTTLSADVGRSSNRNVDRDVDWSVNLQQTIWPSPQLSADRISLSAAEKTLEILQEQRNYVLDSVALKIEELYRDAQLAEARVQFAEVSLASARQALATIEQKNIIGEAGDADLLGGQISVLRAERELEAAEANADTARRNLAKSIELQADFALSSLDIDSPPNVQTAPDVDNLLADVKEHPLVMHYESQLFKAELDLEAAYEARKPDANFSVGVGQNQAGETRLTARITVGYPILDGDKRKTTVEERSHSLVKLLEDYEKEVESLVETIAQAATNLSSLERNREIARLTLEKAKLEWDASEQQCEAGIIDRSVLESAKLELEQAKLDYWEAAFRHDLAARRLSSGIVGDLGGMGGVAR